MRRFQPIKDFVSNDIHVQLHRNHSVDIRIKDQAAKTATIAYWTGLTPARRRAAAMERGDMRERLLLEALARRDRAAELHVHEGEAMLALKVMVRQRNKCVDQMREIRAEEFATGETTLEGRKQMSFLSEELEAIRSVTIALESYWSKLAEESGQLADEQQSAPPGIEEAAEQW